MEANPELLFDRVLLVEDDRSHALLIKRALKRFVKTVLHYESVSEGLEGLKTQAPDLILTDLNLPDTSGLGHISKLLTAGGGIPVVVLTSSTSLREAVEAMRLGANDYIVKNFDTEFSEVLGLALSRLYTTVELSREKARIQREMEVLRIAIEGGHDGLAVVNTGGKIVYSNVSFQTFVKLCGGDSAKVDSIFSAAVKKSKELSESLERNLQVLAPGAIFKTEVLFADNKERAFELSLSVISGSMLPEDGQREAVIWVRDTSEQKRRERFQREILSTTTHDLKGPLGAITISGDLLLEGMQGQDRARELVIRINSCAQSALNLIDEFLSARRIQEGTFILKPVSLMIGSFLREVIDEYRSIATAKQIDLAFEEETPAREIKVDRMGLSRVLGNLLSNALKFTKKGGRVTVRARYGPSDFHLEVEDTGSGMEPSDVQKIFERFSRLERHSDISGSGIGLFVVKSIVTAHGGRIDVTSQLGKGTKFDVSIPYDPPVNERGELISLDFA